MKSNKDLNPSAALPELRSLFYGLQSYAPMNEQTAKIKNVNVRFS
jgi:hypothetical protein